MGKKFLVHLSEPDDSGESKLHIAPLEEKPSPWGCLGLFLAVWLVLLIVVLYNMPAG